MCSMAGIVYDKLRFSLHVLVVSNHWGIKENATSAGVFVDRQISALRKAGVRVSTFDIGTSHSPFQLLKKLWELRRSADDLGVDIVHARYGTIIAALSVLAGFPAVITYCGSDLHPGATISPLRKYAGILLSNFASLLAREIICVSDGLRARLWWCRRKAVVIPDGVDLESFSPGDQLEARKRLGWGLHHPIAIINAARDPQAKGLKIAQEAIAVAKATVPDVELLVVQGIKPDDMPLCYRAADVLVCASNYEGSPNVIKEALACNLPIVSTPVGDVPERLAGVYPSAIVPWDGRAMGKAIAEMLSKRERSNGRQFALELGMQKTAQRVIAVYQAALRGDYSERASL